MAKQGRRETKTEKGENKEHQPSLDPVLFCHMDSLDLGKTGDCGAWSLYVYCETGAHLLA